MPAAIILTFPQAALPVPDQYIQHPSNGAHLTAAPEVASMLNKAFVPSTNYSAASVTRLKQGINFDGSIVAACYLILAAW
jgi:hypothetical protein